MLETLSLVITDTARDAPAVAAAASLARRLDAQLDVTCVGVEPVPVDAVGMGASFNASNLDHTEAQRQADTLARWARSALPSELRARVVAVTAPSFGLVGAVAQVARFSDLVVTARPYGRDHARLAPVIAEALLFGTGAPVLVVPDADRTDWRRPLRTLCLAWNNSDEAMRAARAALPFLREAVQVHVAVVGLPAHGPDDPTSLNALLRWLGRHGVEAEVAALARTERRKKADVLTHFAAERGCEALVLGAYGHSRLREMLLGGTTRDLLAEVPLPLIMAH
jgi:nucleotide-binding universal stress UspA family protein